MIRKLEAELGRPVYFVEIYQGLIQEYGPQALKEARVDAFNLFKDDLVLCDAEMNLYTLNPELQSTDQNPTDYELCSDRIERKFPSY